MNAAKTLVRAAPVFILLSILAIIVVGAFHGWATLAISLIIALPLLAILAHGYAKVRRVVQQ